MTNAEDKARQIARDVIDNWLNIFFEIKPEDHDGDWNNITRIIKPKLAEALRSERERALEEAVEALDKFQEGEGAHGFLTIDCSKEELKKAIRNLGRKRDE